MNKIICIGRQYGSGGREIGYTLAKELGISFYDKEIMQEILNTSDLPRKLLEKADEHSPHSLLHTVLYQGAEKAYYGMESNAILFEMQKKFILKKAQQENCIIVGRCAGSILENQSGCCALSIFVAAQMDDRIQRIMERKKIDSHDASALIRKTDKQREKYYNFYTNKDWGKPSDYDITLNSSKWGSERSIALLLDLYTRLL